MESYSYISNAHPAYIEALYNDYKQNTQSVDTAWQKFFEGFDYATIGTNGTSSTSKTTRPQTLDSQTLLDELKVFNLVRAYRHKGHLEATTNPIKKRKDRKARLQLADFGLTEADLDRQFYAGNQIGLGHTSLRHIVAKLRQIYCGSIGIEYTYVNDKAAFEWLQTKIEQRTADYGLSLDNKKRILSKLNETVVFEQFLHTKYVGQKRFSLEGGESTIPALEKVIQTGAQTGVKEVVIGMAHRGRLNVLANIMGKTYEQIFSEFEGIQPAETMGDGDVKYHLGFDSQIKIDENQKIDLKLVPNPSHLEAVNPVVLGFSRAKADVVYGSEYDSILPILIHGDAAIAGQGIVYEVVQMSQLEGYYTGGTIHFVINNQIGFTTDFDDARSADYCTSVASLVQAPVLHVNGDDVEAVVFAARLAAEYRQKFNSDIFIDMVCYRKHGHNEGDDPQYTQPEMYISIKKHKNPRELYSALLAEKGEIEGALADKMNQKFWDLLQKRLDMVREQPLPYEYQEPEKAWLSLRPSTRADFDQSPVTGLDDDQIGTIVKGVTSLPDGFTPLRKVQKMFDKRRETMQATHTIDWAAGELMAYASILLEGSNVRMSGQDVKRGTFSHRHAVLRDAKTFEQYNRLNHIVPDQKAKFLVYNSLLSEFGVLGFEFGYAMASPDSLVIWEAQFGDFSNGAQTMIDQFITSSESKWQRMAGLVMLLPHGYTGMGPEHSSARLERYLQACAEQNICVANITTPANFFHALRRQQHRPFRKPLIVMSPKSLLRHPKCVSDTNEIMEGTRFQEIIDDKFVRDASAVKRILMCTGKLYYELAEYQEAENRQDIAIVRLEQLYPLAKNQLDVIFAKYKNAEIVWVQEEPANMGALWHLKHRLDHINFNYVARKNSASPATGYKKQHEKEQPKIIKRAFDLASFSQKK